MNTNHTPHPGLKAREHLTATAVITESVPEVEQLGKSPFDVSDFISLLEFRARVDLDHIRGGAKEAGLSKPGAAANLASVQETSTALSNDKTFDAVDRGRAGRLGYEVQCYLSQNTLLA